MPCHRVVYRGIETGVASSLLTNSLLASSIRADVVGGGAEHRGGRPRAAAGPPIHPARPLLRPLPEQPQQHGIASQLLVSTYTHDG